MYLFKYLYIYTGKKLFIIKALKKINKASVKQIIPVYYPTAKYTAKFKLKSLQAFCKFKLEFIIQLF